MNVETAVRGRYSQAAQRPEPALCCPVDYDDRYLKVLPAELIERDYGCGDPSRHLRPGETVLDLGCGGGKICYIAAQVVGPTGRVIGVDKNDDMLTLARRYQQQIGEAIGYHNTQFFKGRIQDLALDLDLLEAHLADQPIGSANDWLATEAHTEQLRRAQPMIPDESVDVVISNCVLNLVAESDRRQLFAEVFRTLRRGGRAVISDIVSDEPVG
ncbi:MAG: methyltransferase domain-containing protein, partial [Planctomycetales bacterium]|nr:methyltransferase domain-containing protein [Planctomycetales bacterium]NIM07892.1 methyltransferase domain-containing protein [Planctomycetales bacterium]NIN07379.1 methyltransferase domain-containing protein [Planctomycetales bacterium]NIN76483.1 methyltransferase domain-containing protein [Planctomycetales bacterium]NIO33673.1 methyltransferase domain-containing protein [Planctomycetales bacterium]